MWGWGSPRPGPGTQPADTDWGPDPVILGGKRYRDEKETTKWETEKDEKPG